MDSNIVNTKALKRLYSIFVALPIFIFAVVIALDFSVNETVPTDPFIQNTLPLLAIALSLTDMLDLWSFATQSF